MATGLSRLRTRGPRYALAFCLVTATLVAYALAADPVANPGGSWQENRDGSTPFDRPATQVIQWVGTGLAIVAFALLGRFVGHNGGTALVAAVLAAPILPAAILTTAAVERTLFPEAYWYFIPPAGWGFSGGWVFAMLLLPIFIPASALIAGVAALVARWRRGSPAGA